MPGSTSGSNNTTNDQQDDLTKGGSGGGSSLDDSMGNLTINDNLDKDRDTLLDEFMKSKGFTPEQIKNSLERIGEPKQVKLTAESIEKALKTTAISGEGLSNSGSFASISAASNAHKKADSEKSSRKTTPSPTTAKRDLTKGGSYTAQGEAATSAARGNTDVGPQVEHPIAYVLLEQLVYSAIEGLPVSEVSDSLVNAFGNLPLAADVIEKIRIIANKVVILVPEEERKIATRQIRGGNHMLLAKDYLRGVVTKTRSQIESQVEESTDSVDGITKEEHMRYLGEIDKGLDRITAEIDTYPIRKAIRLGNRANIAPIVKEIMDECVFGANKMKYGSFPTEGVDPNPNTGQEQYAKNDLLLLSNFILDVKSIINLKISGNDKWQEVLSDDLKVLNDKKSLEELLNKWSVTNLYISHLLDIKTKESLSDKLDNLLKVKVDGVPQLDDLVKYMNNIFKLKPGKTTEKAKKNIENLLNDPEQITHFEDNWGITRSDLESLLGCAINNNLIEDIKSGKDLTGSEVEKEFLLIKKILKAQFDAKETVQDKMTRRMGQLFYYPHLDQDKVFNYTIYDPKDYEKKEKDYLEAPKYKETADWAVSKEDWYNVMKLDLKLNPIKDGKKSDYNKWSKPRNNDPEVMYELTGRHLVVIFNDFKGLSSFGIDSQEEIVDDFLKKSVLKDKTVIKSGIELTINGWEGHIDPKTQSKINLDNLNKNIRGFSEIDYESGKFRSKSSANFQSEQLSSQPHNVGNSP